MPLPSGELRANRVARLRGRGPPFPDHRSPGTGLMTSDTPTAGAVAPPRHPLRGLLVAQAIGAFNDNAWKQVVILLLMATVVGHAAAAESARQGKAAFAQVVLIIPLFL